VGQEEEGVRQHHGATPEAQIYLLFTPSAVLHYCRRWDKKKKAYVNTAGAEDKRGLKLKKIRTESGQTVLAGPGKGEATGQLYKKWAKHNKQRIAATGAASVECIRAASWRVWFFNLVVGQGSLAGRCS
jgi:hypothetical protein